MTISVIVPVLNDAGPLRRLIADLRADSQLEIVVVDGGSDDGSAAVGCTADLFGVAERGRGRQLQAGAQLAGGDWLWFLHADTRVPAATLASVRDWCADAPGWGWFAVRLDSERLVLRVVERAMNWRTAATGIATGDHGIFVHRRLLDAVGGIPEQPLLEDVELCKRLRRVAKPRRRGAAIETSARRWERHGVARTIMTMWQLRLRYFLGADPDLLARRYYPPGGEA